MSGHHPSQPRRAVVVCHFGRGAPAVPRVRRSPRCGKLPFQQRSVAAEEETNKLRAKDLQENLYGDHSQKTVDCLSGKTALKKLKINFGWQVLSVENLETAIADLHEELRKWYLDELMDWLPTDTNSLALRLHYVARASPPEDERTLKTQHVAPGTWYYEVPQGSGNELWLSARQRAVEMLHGIEETDLMKVLFADGEPLWRLERYGAGVAERVRRAPSVSNRLFPHHDYLDNNDAQFFRLNCMIHNCCGGVSGHGTNSTWKIHRGPDSLVWELAKQRVRDRNTMRKHKETTMVRGKRSHFISRRLSYGVAKTPAEHLVSVQKSIQAHFVLSLQSFFRCTTGFTSLWATFLAFCLFVASLFILLTKTDLKWQVVEWGWVGEDVYDTVMSPARSWSEEVAQVLNRSLFECDQDLLEGFILITLQIAVWVATLALVLFVISIITETCKFVQRICLGFGSIWPDEMRWWGRLLILVCNLTHFLWAWMPLFWIGFNLYNVFDSREFHYSPIGMFIFTLILQVLNWGMIGASCMRHSLEASMEANEVVMLTIDNIWRSTQRYYITAPLTDRNGKIAVYLVKYWTLLLEIFAVVAWVYFCGTGHLDEGGLTSLIIITVIALDVLHPCAYLWVGETTMTQELASSMSWYQAFTTLGWWELLLHDLILNDFVTGFLKWLGPAWMIAMPLLTLIFPYLGVNQAPDAVGANGAAGGELAVPGGFRPISMEASASRHLEVEAEGSVEERLERGELENETADSEVQVVPAQPRPNRPEVDERQALTDSIDLEHTRTAMAMFAQRPIWARSTWRYPTVTGEVPRYMQRAFRLKTFGLITLQLLLILLLAVPLRMSGFAEHIPEPEGMENFFHQGIVYMFGVVNLVALLLLNCYKERGEDSSEGSGNF
eukprot:g12331.t1